VEQFLGFAIPGIPFGCTYAMVAVGLVLTYQATGVFNFAFGAQAYLSAFIFTLLVQNEHMPIWLAFVLSVVLLAPVLGLALDRYLFRKIPNSNATAKLVTGITLFVGIPALLPVIFGSSNQYNPPSILFNPDTVYFHIGNTPFNGLYLTSLVATALVLLALTALMRFTNLGLQMRGAVESRRLIQLDGVNAGRVVAVAWAVSSLMAGLAGVLLAPATGQLQAQDYATLMVAAFAAAAWAVLRSLPIAALVGIIIGVADTLLEGYLPASSVWSSATLSSLPFVVLIAALLIVPGLRRLGDATDPLASIDPPTPPTTAALRAPQVDRIIKIGWYVLLAAFVVSMLTWMPKTWENVFNAGLAFSVIFLSITLITGMGGQLSLCQATLAGVGAFTAAQLANHLGLSLLLGGLVGAVAAGAVAVVLAVASLRLRGLGLALMTIAAALFFDSAIFPQLSNSNGSPLSVQAKWVGLDILNPDGHAFFVTGLIVLVVCVAAVLLVRKGTTGRYLSAMRGSETAAAGLGINLTWQRVLIFGISGVVAGIGGTMLTIQQQAVSAENFNYEFSLAFVVIVVTTGVSTVEGAINAGFGFVIIQQLLTYLPARLGGDSLVFVLFAFGAIQYAAHPEGVLEFQKRRWTMRMERLMFHTGDPPPRPGGSLLGAYGGAGGGPANGGGARSLVDSEPRVVDRG
jgi:branched-subunit amino acid ABC-type transport system permease component